MGVFKLLGTEFQKLTGNKTLLLAIIGVLLIPIVYVAILLSTKMHPYDHMDNLPVAVVNKDIGGVSSGEPINVGNDLVQSLKESQTLGFEFVSSEEANKGLKNNEYYLVIEIPEDFSQKVTTVLDTNPQVPELRYIKNEGLNFTASSITNSAVEKIKEQLGDKITATYAKTVFSKFGDIAEGFESGADGSSQIFDGTNQLADGTGQILSSLKEKAPDIQKLAAGAQEADAGAGKLVAGVGTLSGGTGQILGGLKSLQGGSGQILDGLKSASGPLSTQIDPGAQKIATGLNKLNESIGPLNTGATKVADGILTVSDNLGTLATGSSQIADGIVTVNGNLGTLAVGSQKLVDGVDTINAGANLLNGGHLKIEDGIDEINSKLVEFKTGVESNKALSVGIATLNGNIKKIYAGLDANTGLTDGITAVNQAIKAHKSKAADLVGTNAADLKTALNALDAVPVYAVLKEKLIAYIDGTGTFVGSLDLLAEGTTGEQSELYKGAQTYKTTVLGYVDSLEKGTNTTSALAIGAETSRNTVAGTIQQFIAATNTSSDLLKGVTDLKAGSSKLVAETNKESEFYVGMARVAGGTAQLEKATAKGSTLANGASQVAAGADKLKQATAKGSTLADGAAQVAGGVGAVEDGVAQLAPGATTLSNGLKVLNSGLRQLTAGQSTAVSGINDLVVGQTQVNNGVQTLGAGASDLKSGLSQISDGNKTVATGWTTLTDGVTQVNDGVVKLQDGSKELSTGLTGGAEEVSAVQVSEENINMFASPVQLKGDTVNSYEFYRDSTAPFYISLALFVGMLILSFFVDFKKPAVMPGSAIAWYVSKWLQLAIFAVVQALLVSLVTLIVLGLSVSNALLFILFTIIVSLTFMSIIFFLVAVGGHIGRFVAVAFIILQISTTGGNLPVIMLSDGIQSIAKFLPLTYSNAGFKAIISLDDTSFLLSNVLTLLIYLVLFSVLTLVVFVASYKSLSVKAESSITSESAI